MIVHECAVVNSVLYVTALVVLIVYSCLKTTTKNIIIYERIIAVLTSKNKKYCISRRKNIFMWVPRDLIKLVYYP